MLKETFTSTGAKFFAHQEAMRKLRNGRGQAVVTHLMPTDLCQHTCAFCSVQTREGNTLLLEDMLAYVDTLARYGLKAVIISGGGNPILYKCPKTGASINDLICELVLTRKLEVGLITNGMPLKEYHGTDPKTGQEWARSGWKALWPETIDLCTWVRISMSGLDHDESVFVPEFDPSRTTLGFSYVLHDIYQEPDDPHHGKVSRPEDLVQLGRPVWWATDRVRELTDKIGFYVHQYKPRYVRLLPNCLEPSKIPERCGILQEMANAIDPDVVFVQYKPPAAPNVCYLGYIHPVLNSDGYVYPCDSCVLNEKAGHKFDNPWRVCHWSEVARIYEEPVRSLVDPKKLCPGCVFTQSNLLLEGIREGKVELPTLVPEPEHVNFV